jgi:hypothetical protein
MSYGTIKVDTITFTDNSVDKSVSLSGLIQNPTFTGNITVTGTISGDVIRGGTTVSGTTVTGTTANFVSGVFTTQISGATVTGTTASFTSGVFTNISGTTATITSGIIASGTDAAPSLAILADLDTGLFSPGANQLAVATNGTGRLFVDASGNVGVGTSTFNSPSAGRQVLELNGSSSSLINLDAGGTRRAYIFSDSSDTYFYNTQAGPLLLGTNDTERLRITSAGLVGVGTSSPAWPLDVNGVARSTGTSAMFALSDRSTGTGDRYGIYSNSNTFRVYDFPAAADRVVVDSAGLVGIGDSAPESLLHLKGSNATLKIESSVNTGYSGVEFDRAADDTHFAIYAYDSSHASQANNVQFYGYQNGNIQFITNSNATPRLTITSAGLVGIGTTTVNNGVLHVKSNGTGSQSGLAVEASANDSFFSITNNGSAHILGATYNSTGSYQPISFAINGEKARIDTSGRLLVGTSSARSNVNSGAPITQIETAVDSISTGLSIINNSSIGYTSRLALGLSKGSSVGSTTVVSNGDALGYLSWVGADGTNFIESGRIETQVDGTPGANDMPGRLVFSTTADGASSPTERFRISSVGYLRAVGTSSTARIIPDVDNVGYLGQGSERWQAVYAVNGTIQTSDRRQKTDITEALLGSDFIKTLKPVSYKWIEGGKEPTGEIDENGDRVFISIPGQRTHWGFIAQDVKEAVDAAGIDFGGWLLDDKDDPDSQQALRYDQFIAPLTKALQEALAEIDVLKSKVAALESA